MANLKFSIRKPAWTRTNTGTKKDPIILRTETGRPINTSKTCGYCIKVKGWRGIGHVESECRTKKRERNNQESGVKRIDSKPHEEDSDNEFELDQGARITEINSNRRAPRNPRVYMIKAGKVNKNRAGQYEFDTGAQVHTTNELWRLNLKTLRPGKTITACNGTKTTALHEGTLEMNHNGHQITLKNVLYHPSFYNLISGQRVKNIELKRDPESGLQVFTGGEVLYAINQDTNGTMWIKPDEPVGVKKVTLMDLHERYGHISFDTLKSLPEVAQKHYGKPVPKCEACIAGKSTKPPAKKAEKTKQVRSKQPLERLHADLIGPFSKEWLGKKYVLTAMDDYTRYCIAIPIKAKNDTKGALKAWIKMLETQCSPRKITQLQADWGGEFRNTELSTWCKEKGIQMKETIPRHSETNAIIERLNRTLQDMARTAMISSGLKLWGDAIQWAAYTKNRIPHKSLQNTPIEALLGKVENVRSNLRPLGQRVMIHLYKEERDHMAPRAIEARITGYTATHGVYQVITTTRKRKMAKDPRTIDQKEESDGEEESFEWPTKPIQDLTDIVDGRTGRNYGWHCPEKEGCSKGTHTEDQSVHISEQPQTLEKHKSQSPEPDSPSQQLFQEQQQETSAAPMKPRAPEPRRSERMGRDTTNWQDRIKQGLAGGSYINRVGHDDEHPTDKQARLCLKGHEWAKARQIEREKLQKYGVYSVVPKVPEGFNPVDTKWVYDVKKDNAGNITRYRAKKVGRGFTQEYGLNYHETFSQMARSESWRILLAIAVNTPEWTVM